MYIEIKSAIDSVKIISDIVKASKDLRNFNELASAVFEVNEKLLTVTSMAHAKDKEISSLQDKVRLLEKEIMEFENWEAKTKDYTLKEVGPGFFAYISTPTMEQSKAKHLACVKCFEDRKIGVLQKFQGDAYICFQCKSIIEPRINGKFVSIEDAYHE